MVRNSAAMGQMRKDVVSSTIRDVFVFCCRILNKGIKLNQLCSISIGIIAWFALIVRKNTTNDISKLL